MKQWTLQGKRALATGGSKGIGKGIITEFLQVTGIDADVSSNNHRQKLNGWVTEQWGSLDILVNSAGINIRKPTNDYQVHELLQVMEINLYGPFQLCRLFYPLLKNSEHPSIINVASVAGSFDVQTGVHRPEP